MTKYVCELSLLTRHTAWAVIESETEPSRGDLREVYYAYDDAEWHEDPEYAEEGQHGVLGTVKEGESTCRGLKVAELPVYTINEDGDVSRKEG
jgi:hypothetical protein